MILHVGRDEKFIDAGMSTFEVLFPGQNELVLLDRRPGQEVKFVRVHEPRHKVCLQSHGEVRRFLASLGEVDLWVFHGMDRHQATLVRALSPDAKVVWLYIGWEIYNLLPDFDGENLAPLTQALGQCSMSPRPSWLRSVLTATFTRLPMAAARRRFQRAAVTDAQFRAALARPQWVGNFMAEDWELVQRRTGLRNPRLWTIYYNIQDTVGEDLWHSQCDGHHLWLGNSATCENNHLDALLALGAFDLEDREILCPLSYGDPEYAQAVVSNGYALVGGRLHPIRDFLPIEEYNSMLRGASVVIMNHWRQQAVGNVLTSLWFGARLYMSERSPVYRHFKNLGVHIYSVEQDLTPKNSVALDPLEDELRAFNRDLLFQTFSREATLLRMRAELSNVL